MNSIITPNRYRALNIAQFNIPIQATQTTPALNPIFSKNIGGSYGGIITSLSLAFNTSAQQNCNFWTMIDGIDIAPNEYQLPSQTFNTFNYIQSGDYWTLDANAQIKIYAYNQTGTGTNMLLDLISTIKQNSGF